MNGVSGLGGSQYRGGATFECEISMELASKFRVIPVLDVKQGIAVHGRAGRRDEYLPVQSILAPSSDPLTLAIAMRESLGVEEIYLADLDAIAGGEPNWMLLHSLRQASVRIFVDAGIGDVTRAGRMLDALADDGVLIVGLETMSSRELLQPILECVPASRRMVSLDMDRGVVRTAVAQWKFLPPVGVAEELLASGVDQLLLLDISRVGMEQGIGTERLAEQVTQAAGRNGRASLRELWCGGGIRTVQDLVEARSCGCSGALVATALHSGQMTRGDLERIGA